MSFHISIYNIWEGKFMFKKKLIKWLSHFAFVQKKQLSNKTAMCNNWHKCMQERHR